MQKKEESMEMKLNIEWKNENTKKIIKKIRSENN
jgi:hypothetical protein